MSVKHKIQATWIALVLAGAAGFYYFGRGGKLDTGGDRELHLQVTIEATQYSQGIVLVTINGAENEMATTKLGHWDKNLWLRAGETVVLDAHFYGKGNISCSATHSGNTISHASKDNPKYWDEHRCHVSVVG